MYKILIVEDDETIRNGIKTLLELQGYYVDIAVNGVDGLKNSMKHIAWLLWI